MALTETLSSPENARPARSSNTTTANPAEQPRKRVYFVRHGHSLYNEWRDKSWLPWAGCAGLFIGDPLIFDAALSSKGEASLAALRERVQALGLDQSVELVVTTPLTRAIQTALGAFDKEELDARGVQVIASGLHLEVCDTTCDIGTPLPKLRETFRDSVSWEASVGIGGEPIDTGGGRISLNFATAPPDDESPPPGSEPEPEPTPETEPEAQGPLLEGGSADDTSAWWYLGGGGGEGSPDLGSNARLPRSEMERNPWKSGSWSCRRLPCCGCCCPPLIETETEAEVAARIVRFRAWIEGRPERVIVVIGHSAFFQQVTSMPRKLGNCEVLDCQSIGLTFS